MFLRKLLLSCVSYLMTEWGSMRGFAREAVRRLASSLSHPNSSASSLLQASIYQIRAPFCTALLLAGSGLWSCVKSFLLTFSVLRYRRFWAVRKQGHCVSSLHKSCPLFIFPPRHWVYLHICCWWQCSGWLVCLTAREMKSHYVSVWLRKAHGDPGLLLVFAHWGLCYC